MAKGSKAVGALARILSREKGGYTGNENKDGGENEEDLRDIYSRESVFGFGKDCKSQEARE